MRLERGEILQNSTRRRIYEIIIQEPVGSMRALSRELGIPLSTTNYHMNILEKSGYIQVSDFGSNVHVYHSRYNPGGSEEIMMSHLKSRKTLGNVLRRVAEMRRSMAKDIARSLEINAPGADCSLKNLIKLGLVERQEAVEGIFYSPTPFGNKVYTHIAPGEADGLFETAHNAAQPLVREKMAPSRI